jgi:hypothetical protein
MSRRSDCIKNQVRTYDYAGLTASLHVITKNELTRFLPRFLKLLSISSICSAVIAPVTVILSMALLTLEQVCSAAFPQS